MSESQDQDDTQVGISDDKLPEDLQPGEENPLAEGLDDGESVDDLLDGGKDAEQLGEKPADDAGDDRDEDQSGDESADA